MYILTPRISLLLVAYLGFFAVSEALNNGSARGRSAYKSENQKSSVYNGLGYANGDYQMKHTSGAKPVESKSQSKGGIGLSAWGIIGVLGGSLLLGTFFYYATLFYPILCKKERKNQNQFVLDCCPSAPPALDSIPALSTPV